MVPSIGPQSSFEKDKITMRSLLELTPATAALCSIKSLGDLELSGDARMPALAIGLASERADERRRERKQRKPEPRRPAAGRRRRARLAACSPDSVTTVPVPAPASRSSFGSDLDALSSISSSYLAGRDADGPDLDREKVASFSHCDTLTPHPTSCHHHAPESKELEEEQVVEEEDDNSLDPASHSFSLAVRECQERRLGSEVLSSPGSKPRKRRPASLDLNGPTGIDATVLSPRFLVRGAVGVKKSSAASSRSRSGVFPSPGTPSYRIGMAAGYNKGWSSERVPHPSNSSRRYLPGSALLPFNNGRMLPSKWEDAEKWICSPVSGDGVGRMSVPPPHHRRPKSKSGPLGAPAGIGGHYLSASPLVPCFDSGRGGSFTAASPFLAGVMMADRGCCASYSSAGSGVGGGSVEAGRRSSSANADPCIVRSASVHGWSDAQIESSSSLPSSQDEKHNNKEAVLMSSPVVLRKDMATQMSPEGSTNSSPKERASFSALPSSQPIEELGSHLSKMEVRDVQVDDRVTMTRWSKKHIVRFSDKRSTNIIEWKKKTVEAKGASWEVTDTTKCLSKYKREEAKITAWENLQKAKAEAAIRKLEMKLEKKRSSSMDKILNKLRSAQRKAEEMRTAVTESHRVARSARRISHLCKTRRSSSLSGCFTCHAF